MSFARLLAVSVAVLWSAYAMHGQSTAKRQDENKVKPTPPTAQWIEDKVSVRLEKPYISEGRNLVLVYTVTNKSGEDVTIGNSTSVSLFDYEIERVYFKLKDRESYVQVTPQSATMYFLPKLIPADIPVLFQIVLTGTIETKKSWFSSESAEEKLWNAISKQLGNTESIAVFLPYRKLKISFPIPTPPKK